MLAQAMSDGRLFALNQNGQCPWVGVSDLRFPPLLRANLEQLC